MAHFWAAIGWFEVVPIGHFRPLAANRDAVRFLLTSKWKFDVESVMRGVLGQGRVGIVLLVLALSSPLLPAAGQEADPVTEAIQSAFQTADVDALLDRSSSRIAIAVFGSAQEYSRRQATYVLQDFFAKYPPADFQYRDEYSTKRGRFLEGMYGTNDGDRELEVYLQLRLRKDQWELREIIIRSVRD